MVIKESIVSRSPPWLESMRAHHRLSSDQFKGRGKHCSHVSDSTQSTPTGPQPPQLIPRHDAVYTRPSSATPKRSMNPDMLDTAAMGVPWAKLTLVATGFQPPQLLPPRTTSDSLDLFR